jgi:hypothetical protein
MQMRNAIKVAADPGSDGGGRSFMENEPITQLLKRLQSDPALRAWVLMAPTRALATLGVAIDDYDQVQLLERIEALDVSGPAAAAMSQIDSHFPGSQAVV